MNGAQSTSTAAPATQVSQNNRKPAKQVAGIKNLFGMRAAWLHFATEIELRQLSKLHLRIERRSRGLSDLIGERQKIMNRCIRRMRRTQGKN